MTLNYFENSVPNLIEDYFQLSFSDDVIPFQSTILPQGFTHITNVFYGDQTTILNKKEMALKDLVISGQFFRSYQLHCQSKTMSFGISFHPTALFKILNTDISKLENKHTSLLESHPDFYHKISHAFTDYSTSETIVNKLNAFFSNIELNTNQYTENIDVAIDLIKAKEGLLSITEILKKISISQKALETQFKMVVGLTPGKYIRLFRFLNLMRKYENGQVQIGELIYMFDYYDRSHFTRDFKLFMNETPKSYFKKDYPLLKAVFQKV